VDRAPSGLEVGDEDLAPVVRVGLFGGAREADQVGEEDRHEPPFCAGARFSGRRRLVALEPGAALAAEALARLVRRSAHGAHDGERGAAFGAELPSGAVLGAAGATEHANTVIRMRAGG